MALTKLDDRYTAAELTTNNPYLGQNQIVKEKDTSLFKIGPGNWADLSYSNDDETTLPVKATGAETDTGTNDAKFLTPKAIADSSYAKTSDIDTAFEIETYDAADDTESTDVLLIRQLTEAVAATGTYTIGVNPTEDDTIGFNGVEFTFKDSAVEPDEIEIGTGATGDDTDLGITIDNVLTALNASVDADLSGATYSDNHTASNKDGTVITVTFDTAGTAGNAYTLDTDTANIERSAATLAGGSAAGYATKSIELGDLATAIDGILNP